MKGHIRVIYAKAISVVDTTERDQALKVRMLNKLVLLLFIFNRS